MEKVDTTKWYGIVLWDQKHPDLINSLYHEGIILHEKDGTRYIGTPYCADCAPPLDYIYAVIRYDYGFKRVCRCAVCKKVICGRYDKKRKIYTPPSDGLV